MNISRPIRISSKKDWGERLIDYSEQHEMVICDTLFEKNTLDYTPVKAWEIWHEIKSISKLTSETEIWYLTAIHVYTYPSAVCNNSNHSMQVDIT